MFTTLILIKSIDFNATTATNPTAKLTMSGVLNPWSYKVSCNAVTSMVSYTVSNVVEDGVEDAQG